jgi:cell division protein FtsB
MALDQTAQNLPWWRDPAKQWIISMVVPVITSIVFGSLAWFGTIAVKEFRQQQLEDQVSQVEKSVATQRDQNIDLQGTVKELVKGLNNEIQARREQDQTTKDAVGHIDAKVDAIYNYLLSKKP